MSNVVIPVIVGAVCAVVFAVLGFVLGVAHRRKTAEKEIGSATQEATKIINNALAEAEASKKEKVLEAKDEVHKLRSDADRDIRERRNEVQRQEKRLNQREEYLDKKADSLEAKNDKISEKQKELENKLLEVDGIKKSQFDMLERISGLTQEEAKNQLLASLEEELDTEKSKKILEYEQMTRDQSEVLAREIIGTAIQRCAADHTAETTVSVVALPNDEMKGRIIGRVGRNIRALEAATGIEIIVDDTPEAIILSGFDPVRREIARLALHQLVTDGRIHPARIEEMVEKARREVDQQIREAGEQADGPGQSACGTTVYDDRDDGPHQPGNGQKLHVLPGGFVDGGEIRGPAGLAGPVVDKVQQVAEKQSKQHSRRLKGTAFPFFSH